MATIEKLEKLEKQIEELKAEVKRLKNEKELERTEHYYFINIDGDGDFYVDEDNDGMTTKLYQNMNYFLSVDSAKYVLSAIYELRKLQHLHDIYCPDYVPNWNNENEAKWYVYFKASKKKYSYGYTWLLCKPIIYFDSEETAGKVCDRMNENL